MHRQRVAGLIILEGDVEDGTHSQPEMTRISAWLAKLNIQYTQVNKSDEADKVKTGLKKKKKKN